MEVIEALARGKVDVVIVIVAVVKTDNPQGWEGIGKLRRGDWKDKGGEKVKAVAMGKNAR